MLSPCLNEFRCRLCHKLLFKGLLVEGTVEIKCKACGELTVLIADHHDALVCLLSHCPNRVALPRASGTDTA